jgi:hypothetical protein
LDRLAKIASASNRNRLRVALAKEFAVPNAPRNGTRGRTIWLRSDLIDRSVHGGVDVIATFKAGRQLRVGAATAQINNQIACHHVQDAIAGEPAKSSTIRFSITFAPGGEFCKIFVARMMRCASMPVQERSPRCQQCQSKSKSACGLAG